MPGAPAPGAARLHPYLAYADAPAAIEFLCEAFGFEERFRYAMPDGRIGHAELAYGDDLLYLASAYEELGFRSPSKLAGVHSQVHLVVDDVDAHCARAKSAGAVITAEPADQFYGDRSYRAIDPEGHRWIFATHVRDVPPEEWDPPADVR
jgi:PhnB protein